MCGAECAGLGGAHLFLAKIENLQIDAEYAGLDMEEIELEKIRSVIYAPYHYYNIGGELGKMGEWKDRIAHI